MRSQFVDKFNHDDDAADYDEDVLNEQDPIRAGYADVLKWVAANARISADDTVVDLGCGTGNLTLQLPPCAKLYCVDASKKMLQIAEAKLHDLSNIRFFQADILEFFDNCDHGIDSLVSTYAVHHLTKSEKAMLFDAISGALNPGGSAAFGDLMFQSESDRTKYLRQLRANGQDGLADDIEDEFFWDVEWSLAELRKRGFSAEARRMSELSWGIVAQSSL